MPENKKPRTTTARHYLSSRLHSNKLVSDVTATASWNSFFLAVVAMLLFSGGLALIIIFSEKEKQIQDLILIGAILLASGLVFIIMFLVSLFKILTAYRNDNRKVAPASHNKVTCVKNNPTDIKCDSGNITDGSTYMKDSDRHFPITPEITKHESRPSASLLYGTEIYKDRVVSPPPQIVLPVTNSDLTLEDENTFYNEKDVIASSLSDVTAVPTLKSDDRRTQRTVVDMETSSVDSTKCDTEVGSQTFENSVSDEKISGKDNSSVNVLNGLLHNGCSQKNTSEVSMRDATTVDSCDDTEVSTDDVLSNVSSHKQDENFLKEISTKILLNTDLLEIADEVDRVSIPDSGNGNKGEQQQRT